MNFSQLIIKGEILKVLEKEYKGDINYQIQFLTEDTKNGFKVIPVKVPNELYNGSIKEKDIVEIPIKISSMNNMLYYTANEKIKLLNK